MSVPETNREPRPVRPDAATLLSGRLHVYVAFDWGEEVDLDLASRLAPAEAGALARRPRTPTSIAYKPPPLRFRLAPVSLALPGLDGAPFQAEATVFDFAAVSVALRGPIRLAPVDLASLASRLSDPGTTTSLIRSARAALEPLHRQLLPAIRKPFWHDSLWEEYFVFQLTPGGPVDAGSLLGEQASWLAGLVRLEDQPLSTEEVAEAVRLSLRYGRDDLFVPDWAAAALLDREPDCDETLQTVEFANLQLLEYRHIDDRLDATLGRAYHLIQQAARSRLPFWRSHDAPLRVLGELRVEANGLFERTGNVLKLVGDQYLARVYRLLAARFHLRDWQRSIERKLEVIEGVYKVLADQTITFRTEFMEVVVIVLILLEVLLAMFRH